MLSALEIPGRSVRLIAAGPSPRSASGDVYAWLRQKKQDPTNTWRHSRGAGILGLSWIPLNRDLRPEHWCPDHSNPVAERPGGTPADLDQLEAEG